MGLLNLVKRGIHDIEAAPSAVVHAVTNTPQPARTQPQVQQPKPVVQTPGPALQVRQPQQPTFKIQQPNFQQPKFNVAQPAFNQPKLTQPTIQQPKINQVVNAKPQTLGVNGQQLQQGQGVIAGAKPKQVLTPIQQFGKSKLGSASLGAARSLVGTGQAASGLVDLATPGTGTNRFSKMANQAAQNIDNDAKFSNKPIYHGTQAVTDLAQFVTGGGEAKAAAKASPLLAKAGEVANVLRRPVINVADKLAEGGVKQQVAAKTLKAATDPRLLAANAAQQAFYTGQQASKGQGINPVAQLAQFGVGQIGLPLAGAAASEALRPVADKAVGSLRNANVIAPSRLNPEQVDDLRFFNNARGGYDMNDSIYNKGIAAAQKANVNPNDADAVNRLLTDHAIYNNKVQEAGSPLMNASRQLDNILNPKGLAIGGSTKKVTGIADDAATPKVTKLPTTEPIATTETLPVNNTDIPLPQNTPKVVQNSLTKGAQEGRQNISTRTANETSGEHIVRSTAQLAEDSAKQVNSLPANDAIEQAHSMLTQPLGHVSDAQTGFISKAIERADTEAARASSEGRLADADRYTREASALHDGLSEHAVARGQANQALVMLYNQSPQGLLYRAIKDLGRAGVKDSPELRAKLQPLVEKIKAAADQPSKIEAIARFHQAVSKEMPQSLSDKLTSIWKAGLLSGVKTHQGNIISNATFKAGKKLSDPVSAGVDKLISLGTGKRTIGLTQKGELNGGIEGLKNAAYTLKTGIDKRNISTTGGKYEQHAEIDFSNKVIDKTIGNSVRGIFRILGAADQPFWYSQFKNSMYDQAKAEGLTKKLKGKQLSDFMEQRVKDPTPQMAETALKDANKSTLGYDTLGSKAVEGIHRGIDNFAGASEGGKAAAHAAVNVLAPFVKVPTAFISRTVDFTPLGIPKEVLSQVFKKQFDQRAFSQAIGEGATGMGVIGLGIALSQSNLLSGDYPSKDQKEQQRWKAEGITPNSVKVGNKWISLNYLGPVGLLFNAGKQINDAAKQGEGKLSQSFAAIAGLGQGLLGQSFLQGFSGFTNAITDPQRSAKSFINSEVGSIVPSIVNDAANLTDKFQRQANSAVDTIKSRIPGARESLPVKTDVYGNQLTQAGGQGGTVNGLKPSNSLTNRNDVIAEVNRLHNADQNNKDLQVTPTPIDKKLTVDGVNLNLDDKQRNELQTSIGQLTQSTWGQVIKSSTYNKLDDIGKADLLNKVRQDAYKLAERNYVTDKDLGQFTKNASKRVVALGEGNPDWNSYVKGESSLSIKKPVKTVKAKTSKRRYATSKRSGGSTKGSKTSLSAIKAASVNYSGTKQAAKLPRYSAGNARISQGKVALRKIQQSNGSSKGTKQNKQVFA